MQFINNLAWEYKGTVSRDFQEKFFFKNKSDLCLWCIAFVFVDFFLVFSPRSVNNSRNKLVDNTGD